MPPWPRITKLDSWKMALATNVTSASADPDIAPCIDALVLDATGHLAASSSRWCRRAVLVQEGATASEAWAAYHGCYEGDCLSEAMVASRCMSPPLLAGWNLVTSPSCGDLAEVEFGVSTPWPKPQRGGFSVGGWTMGGGTSLLRQALPPPNWEQQGINLGTSPTKLGPAGDQSGHFPHQTGTSRGSIWALPPPNWDQQGINLGTSPTKLGPAGDQSGHFPHQIGHFPHQTGTSRGSIWALPPPNWALPPPNWDQQGINLKPAHPLLPRLYAGGCCSAAPGRYATEAMERSGSDPDGDVVIAHCMAGWHQAALAAAMYCQH